MSAFSHNQCVIIENSLLASILAPLRNSTEITPTEILFGDNYFSFKSFLNSNNYPYPFYLTLGNDGNNSRFFKILKNLQIQKKLNIVKILFNSIDNSVALKIGILNTEFKKIELLTKCIWI